MLVCTYWTNEAYRRMAERCMESARVLGLHTYGCRREPQGGFYHSTRAKGGVLLEALAAAGETDVVVWVDADCRFVKYPILLAGGDWDVACKTDGEAGAWGTVVGVRTTGPGMRFLRDWANYRSYDKDDEAALRRALFPLREGCRLLHLPPGYVWTDFVHSRKFPDEEIVIEHHGNHMRLPRDARKALG